MKGTIAIERSAVREVGQLLHPPTSRYRLLAVLKAYFDESGTHAGSNICALAGFVGSEEEWSIFERRWKRALEIAGIHEFHMSKFESRQGHFQGWSETRRKSFLAELVKIIKARELQGVGSALVTADYKQLSEEDRSWLTHGKPDCP